MRRRSIAAFAVGLPLALAAAAAVAQWLQWSMWRYELQRHVDEAAESALVARQQGQDSMARVRAELAQYDLVEDAIVENPPRAGYFAGDRNAFRVTAERTRRPFLAPLIGDFRITAAATAAAVPADEAGAVRIARVE